MNYFFDQIEAKLNCQFPERFKQLVQSSGHETIILDLIDEPYQLLDSFFNESVEDQYERVDAVSNMFKDDYYQEDKDFVTLPFARVMSGDRYKYLYFQGQPNQTIDETIWIRDLDSPKTGRLKIASSIDFLLGDRIEEDRLILSNKNKSFLSFASLMELPKEISMDQKDSSVITRENDLDQASLQVDFHAKICTFANYKENFTIFYTDITLHLEGVTVNAYHEYSINNYGVGYQIENNINYRIYYHKFHCLLNSLKLIYQTLIEKYPTADKAMITNLIDTSNFARLAQKGWTQIDYYKE